MTRMGIDLVDVRRIKEKAEKSSNFVPKLLTNAEYEYLLTKPTKTAKGGEISPYFQTLAGFFAAKEAFLKALGIGFSTGLKLKEIQVLHNANGAPILKVDGSLKEIVDGLGVKNCSISISHDGDYAIAVVSVE